MNPQDPYLSYQTAYNADPGKTKRIIIVAVGAVVLLLVGLSALAFMGGDSKDRASVAKLVALNAEMARVAELALDSDAARTPARNLAINIKIIGQDNQSEISTYMTKLYKKGVTEAEVKSASNKEIDSFLVKAGERNTYDEDFAGVIKELLESANDAAASASALTSNEQLKTLMTKVTEENKMIIEGIGPIDD